MYSILKNLESKSKLLIVVIFLIVLVIMLNIINGDIVGVEKLKQITNGIGILDLEQGYSVEKAYKILDMQGDKGRAYYLTRILPMDFIFPLTYMLFYCAAILFLLKQVNPQNRMIHYLALAPVLQALCDYLENIAIIKMLIEYPDRIILTAKAANVFTISKLILGLVSIGIFSVLIIALCLIWLSRGKAGLIKRIDQK
jgi:hypothetical protein